MASRVEKLRELLEPSVNDLGYELVDVEYHPGRKTGVLRLYIDAEAGIGLDDCEQVSRQVSAVLDVDDPISGQYNLEVSSPGLDRVLRTDAHFERFLGHEVRILLRGARDGRRKFKGLLAGAGEGQIEVTVDDRTERFDIAEIEQARLVPDLSAL